VALVTGAGRGIGRAVAKLFAAEGARVAVVSLTPANVDRVVAEIVAAGGDAVGIACDIADGAQIKDTVARAVDAFGRLDILVNNAFDVTSAMSSVLDLSAEQLQRQMDTGPFACLRLMQACYPHLAERGGRIINLASSVGVLGIAGYAPYAISKEAVRALTRVAAREWGAKGITVNNILPIAKTDAFDASTDSGATWQPNTPLARLGSPEEDIAPVALFLASKDSQFLTGYSLTPDGGFLIDTAR
jgi:NAD(P)-dependent dehydrogenase (short-subunit alcohol dehydrogenase family)